MDNVNELREIYTEGRHQDAWHRYTECESHNDPEWHLYGALAAWRSSQHYQAKPAIERALAAGGGGGVRGRILFVAGELNREIGDLITAEEYLEAFIGGFSEYMELRPLLEGAAWHNLGLTYYGRRAYEKAAHAASRAADAYAVWGDHDNQARAIRNASWALCCLGQAEDAAALLRTIDGRFTGDDHRYHQQVGWAFVELTRGNHDGCVELADRLLANVRTPKDVQAQAGWIAGRAHLALGDVHGARRRALAAQTVAIELVDPRSMTDVCDLLRRIDVAESEGA